MSKKTRRIKVNEEVKENKEIVNDQEPIEPDEELEDEEEKEFFLKKAGRAIWNQRWKIAAGAALLGGTVAGFILGRSKSGSEEESSSGNEPLKLTGGYDDSTENYDNLDSGDSYEESEIS